MSAYSGKTVVVSGGAEGIGFSIARALGRQGMNVVLGDIDTNTLAKAEAQLQKEGVPVLAVPLDVVEPQQWQALAERAIARFGSIHMLVNNAGIGSGVGRLEDASIEDWRWAIDVNLVGVLNGAQSIVPHIKAHGEGGWLINVASIAGMSGVPFAGAYTATKVAVVGMSEAWAGELAGDNIKVSVLCPAFVKTRIHFSERNRQQAYKKESTQHKGATPGGNKGGAAHLVEAGIPARLVGPRVVEALDAGEFYIFTHPSHRKHMQKRFEKIDKAFESAASSPILKGIDDPEITDFA